MNKEELEKELNQATDGLLMQSDIEAPFDFFYRELQGQAFSPELVAEWAGKPAGMHVDTQSLDDFFSQMKGLGTDARNKAAGGQLSYQQLKDTLNRLLEDVNVYCISQIGTEVFLLGRTENGDYAGLRTMVMHNEASIDQE